VALARAIAVEPDIILFDEPLSNLDAKLREDLRLELQQLQRELGFSAIYVTHDQDEAISLSSRIVIMNGGICEQEGPPPVIWRDPATRFVARFIGSKNSLKGRVVSRQEGMVRVETEAGPVIECGVSHIPPEAEAVELFIGSGEIDLLPQPSGAANSFPGEVSLVSFQGESTLYEVRFGSKKLAVRCPGEARYSEGQHVGIRVPPASVHGYALEVD